MGREIKFRAWDTEYKRWGKPDGIGLDDGIAFSATGDGYIDDKITNYPEYVIQQYTGLTDRHGAEIYEGDILKLDGRHRTPQGEYMEVSGVMEWEQKRNGWTQFSPIERFEVIGNIYETPELIKEPK